MAALPKTTEPFKLLYLDSSGIKRGYRYGTPQEHYDVFWTRRSDHYVIMEEWKDTRKRDPWPLEVHDLRATEQSLDQRCLLLLKEKLIGWGLSKNDVEKASVVPARY